MIKTQIKHCTFSCSIRWVPKKSFILNFVLTIRSILTNIALVIKKQWFFLWTNRTRLLNCQLRMKLQRNLVNLRIAWIAFHWVNEHQRHVFPVIITYAIEKRYESVCSNIRSVCCRFDVGVLRNYSNSPSFTQVYQHFRSKCQSFDAKMWRVMMCACVEKVVTLTLNSIFGRRHITVSFFIVS